MFIGRPTRSSQILTSTGMSVHLPLVNFFIYGGSLYMCAITHVSVDNLECHSSPSTLLRPFEFVTVLTRLANKRPYHGAI